MALQKAARKERAGIRKLIIEKGFQPYLEKDGTWDTWSILDPQQPGIRIFTGGVLRTQIRKMTTEGYWELPAISRKEKRQVRRGGYCGPVFKSTAERDREFLASCGIQG